MTTAPEASGRRRGVALALVAAVAVGCGGAEGPTAEPAPRPTQASSPASAPVTETPSPPASPSPSAVASPTATASAPPSAEPTPSPTGAERTTLVVHVERRTNDAATEGFVSDVLDILTDPRGWTRAGFDVVLADPPPSEDGASSRAPYRIILAEGDEVDRLCLPYDTYGQYSCQNGATVALNADRWRGATPSWTGSLDEYRAMLVNHEVGHLLHLHHPRPQCPGQGFPAPVMMQQSTELGACTANPWPLPWEVDLAAERREPLAPPADHDVSDHRPAPPRQQQDTTHRAPGY